MISDGKKRHKTLIKPHNHTHTHRLMRHSIPAEVMNPTRKSTPFTGGPAGVNVNLFTMTRARPRAPQKRARGTYKNQYQIFHLAGRNSWASWALYVPISNFGSREREKSACVCIYIRIHIAPEYALYAAACAFSREQRGELQYDGCRLTSTRAPATIRASQRIQKAKKNNIPRVHRRDPWITKEYGYYVSPLGLFLALL